jgi:O-acetyl-ADP-ribose deacetylase (regulator of RNase III)
MLHFVQGDILLTRAAAIAHGIAPHDHFDSGLALSLRERWPAMVRDFRHFCHNDNPGPGGAWAWAGAGGTRIINLMTQEPAPRGGGNPGRASVTHVNHALGALRKIIEKEKLPSVALPRIATGVGGLDWSDVRPLLQRHLADISTPVFVYEAYRAGQQAEEPGL